MNNNRKFQFEFKRYGHETSAFVRFFGQNIIAANDNKSTLFKRCLEQVRADLIKAGLLKGI